MLRKPTLGSPQSGASQALLEMVTRMPNASRIARS
jgi:hypothetical protein